LLDQLRAAGGTLDQQYLRPVVLRQPDDMLAEVEEGESLAEDVEQIVKAIDSAGGFSLVLAGAKILLEHGIEPNLVLDRYPNARLRAWDTTNLSADFRKGLPLPQRSSFLERLISQ